MHTLRMLSTTNNMGIFSNFFKELNEAQDQDEKLTKMEDFSKVVYENLDNIRQDDISNGITQLFETVKTAKRGQSVLIN